MARSLFSLGFREPAAGKLLAWDAGVEEGLRMRHLIRLILMAILAPAGVFRGAGGVSWAGY